MKTMKFTLPKPLKKNIEMKKRLVIFCLACAAVLFSLVGCKQTKEKTTIQKGKITESVYASGYVKARNQYQVFAATSGILQEILVEEGDTVQKGDVLFRVANPINKYNEENAKLASRLAQENLTTDKLDELLVNLELSKARLKQDSLMFERQKKLWESKIGTKLDFETRELAFRSSKAAYQSAVFRFRDAKRQLGFLAEQSKNTFLASSSLSNDNLVKSGIDGVVYALMREQGEMVGPQTPLAVVGDAKEYYLELQIDEFDITKVRPGQIIKVRLDSYKDKVFEARVTKVNPLMNERSRSFFIEAVFIDMPAKLYPNLTVEANIILLEKDQVITIQRNYLIGDSLVILENGDTQRVQIGLKDYQRAEVISGIKENQVLLKPGK
jgi:multidrug efflux pump subunit AcrA (membrane-fusion protein)